MRATIALLVAGGLASASTFALPARAQAAPSDSDRAREELEHGYALRKSGQYAEALELLRDSYRLAPQLKTLINVADCEEHLHKLVDARGHWIEARDQATKQGEATIAEDARKRVDSLERRTPQITLRLPEGAPGATDVLWDGDALSAEQLGRPMRADAGSHMVLVRLPGRQLRHYGVELAEGDRQTLDVAPSDADDGSVGSLPPPVRSSPWRTAGWTAIAVGAVGVVIGSVLGVEALTKKSDANCPSNACGRDGDPEALRAATRDGNVAIGFLVASGALAIGGITVLLVTPKDPASDHAAAPRASLTLAPSGLSLQGAW